MVNYLTPGVYVEEVPASTQPIQAGSTSTACFIGTGNKPDAPVGVPTPVTNWSQYRQLFLGDGPFTPLSLAVRGFFDNTQGRCYVLDLGPDGSLAGTAESPGLSVLEAIDEIAIVCAPGRTTPTDYNALIDHCEKMRDRLTILDPPARLRNAMALTRVATEEAPGEHGSPDADAGPAPGSTGVAGPPAGSGRAPAAGGTSAVPESLGPKPSPYAVIYYPWLLVADPRHPKQSVLVPPSGHMAGVWARTDALRGVHKAPANESIHGINGIETLVSPSEQAELNDAGINVIRKFDALGIRPWGARTLARGLAPEWRYINVRRLFCMAEEAIAKGTAWIVFEPNDRELWSMIVNSLRAFLTGLWRDGALMGRTPDEAFFVKCDAETNPPDVVDAGRVVAVVGMAPVKPAEFVVFKVSQFSGGTTFEEENVRG